MNAPTIKIEGSGAAAYIHIRVTSDTDGLATREYVDSRMSAKLDANHGSQNAGKLMYIGADGTLVPLALGAGLEIRDGVLVVTATGAVAAEITVDEAGNAIVTGATMTVDEAGNATFTGAVLTVDEAGNATLK